MTTRHTPGPWVLANCNSKVIRYNGVRYESVCTLSDTNDYQANARLIAAAPELLSVVKHAKRILSLGIPTQNEQIAIDFINAAISLVEGGPDAD